MTFLKTHNSVLAKLILIVITLIISCDQIDELEPDFSGVFEHIQLEQDKKLADLVSSLTSESNINARINSTSFNTEFGVLKLDEIIKRLSHSEQVFPIYSIRLIPPSDSIQTVEYLVLKAYDNQYLGFILQYESNEKLFDDSYFRDYSGKVRILDLERQVWSEEEFKNGVQINPNSVNGRTSETYNNCDCHYTFEPVEGPVTGNIIDYDVYIDCTCSSGGGGGSTTGDQGYGTPMGGTNDPWDPDSGPGGGGTEGSSGDGDSGAVGISDLDARQLFEWTIRNTTDPNKRRSAQLQYINDFGGLDGREFKKMVDEFLDVPNITVGEVYEINEMVNKAYYELKAQYIMAAFNPETIGTVLFLATSPGVSNSVKNSFFKVISRYSSNSAIGKGYTSFTAFKNAHGTAGTGKAWHHIVSQRSSNIAKFGANQIHNTKNLVKLPHGAGSWHQRITNFYNSVSPNGINTEGLRFGEWLAKKTFQEQVEWGIRVMNWMK